nr:hypothetical protein [Streptomyces sulfonofaciens]
MVFGTGVVGGVVGVGEEVVTGAGAVERAGVVGGAGGQVGEGELPGAGTGALGDVVEAEGAGAEVAGVGLVGGLCRGGRGGEGMGGPGLPRVVGGDPGATRRSGLPAARLPELAGGALRRGPLPVLLPVLLSVLPPVLLGGPVLLRTGRGGGRGVRLVVHVPGGAVGRAAGALAGKGGEGLGGLGIARGIRGRPVGRHGGALLSFLLAYRVS